MRNVCEALFQTGRSQTLRCFGGYATLVFLRSPSEGEASGS
jgi:hypothetical protein